MGSDTGRPRNRRLQTVLGRLALAALLILLPIFALGIFAFAQLDSQSARFSSVAEEAAGKMRLVDGLRRGIERIDFAVDAYFTTGDANEIAVVDRVAPGVGARLARSRDVDREEVRELAIAATRRLASISSRFDRARDLWRNGRPPPESFRAEHESDVKAAEALVTSMLIFSREQIEAEVAAGREKRSRDRWLLGLQIALGLILAAWVSRRLARQTVGPLAHLSAAADRLRAGHLDERVPIDGPVELERMGAAFNEMAETLQTQQADLRRLAYADPVTGLPNRTAFLERVETAEVDGGPVAVLFLDLDDFKSVNDALGHTCGDRLLVEVGRRISDTLGPTGTVARLGGDEFAILLPDAGAGDGAAVVLAEHILAALAAPMTIAGVEIVPAASVGIAVGSAGAAALLRDADVAMYEAKRAGRHGHATFVPAMQAAAGERLAGMTDLRQALDLEQFQVVYQPIVDLRTRALLGTEALVRWAHPLRGLVSPAEFIPLAEQTGLIVSIGQWVLGEACRQAAAWQAAHPASARFMSVNLSTRQLLEPELVDQVRAALEASGLPPTALMLEITESAVMADPAAAIARLRALGGLGVRLAIDDFGTGHSSLAYLRDLPVHELKIAREFVAGMDESQRDFALARGILSLGHGLDLRVIAEGIETEAQHAQLEGMGCDLGQGYLYSRPLSAAAIAPLLAPIGPLATPFVATTALAQAVRA